VKSGDAIAAAAVAAPAPGVADPGSALGVPPHLLGCGDEDVRRLTIEKAPDRAVVSMTLELTTIATKKSNGLLTAMPTTRRKPERTAFRP